MDIFVNNNQETIISNQNLDEYLLDKDIFHKQGIAIAINDEIIQKKYWAKIMLKEGDKVLIIQATQGG